MRKTKHLPHGVSLDQKGFEDLFRQKIDSVDFKKAKDDVAP
jgi:hypothetical protein